MLISIYMFFVFLPEKDFKRLESLYRITRGFKYFILFYFKDEKTKGQEWLRALLKGIKLTRD